MSSADVLAEPRLIGALLRIPFQATVARVHADLLAAGYRDLRPAHFAVFQHLRPGGSRVTELAEQAQMTKQSMGYLVDALEERGYVERVPDPADRRAKKVRLTDRGREVAKLARASIDALTAEWAEQLGAERMRDLRATLVSLVALIEGSERGDENAVTIGAGRPRPEMRIPNM